MNKKLIKKISKGTLAVSAGLAAFLIGGTATLYAYGSIINSALSIPTSTTIEDPNAANIDSAYYKSDYVDSKLLAKNVNELTADEREKVADALVKLNADQDAYVEYEMENSAVLLRNENGALPLKANERTVNLFGFTSKQPLYSCTSGGGKNDWSVDAANNLTDWGRVVDFYHAFKNKGFTINDTLYNAYPEGKFTNVSSSVSQSRETSEPNPDTILTSAVESSVKTTGGVGIVFLSREGGEGDDIDRIVDGRSGLALTVNEEALLAKVKNYKQNGWLTKIIVIHNSPYAMELGWFDKYDVDAALHIGTIGLKGSLGLVDLMTGAANPSGHLVDTFATNSLSSAAVQTWYDQSFTGVRYEGSGRNQSAYFGDKKVSNSGAEKYMVLTEGIYTGYKYYETRYEDSILNRYNATSTVGSTEGAWNYANEMTFPFGYGLSYTTFKQTLNNVSSFNSEKITVNVTVENTGSEKGRSVVQVYAQTPYEQYEIDHNVEKSAIQLVGFGKTKEIAPGKTDTIDIEIDRYLLAAWDSTAHNGEGGYILSAGDYYFAIGDNVHDALNNVLAKKGATGLVDENGTSVTGDTDKVHAFKGVSFNDTAYKFSAYTGNRVKNQFSDSDINYWLKGAVTYMTRSNWMTYPTETPQLTPTKEMIDVLSYAYTTPEGTKGINESEFGVDAGLKLVDMKDVEWDDDYTWNLFLHQLTLDELKVSVADSFGTAAIESIGKRENIEADGPDGWNWPYLINGKKPTCYIGEAIAACSFDVDMFEKRANFLAEDGMFTHQSQSWAPGGNLHRTPFSGRNHEYFSEDATMNFIYLPIEVNTLVSRGISVGGKHFAGNDVELNRNNGCLFQTEQSYRQNALRGFESSFTKGGATSTMNQMGSIGLRNQSEDYASQVAVLRNEWGFKGVVIADAGSGRGPEGIFCGTDQWCLSGSKYADSILTYIREHNDGDMLDALLLANKRYYYAFSKTIDVNGLTSGTKIKKLTPWWQSAVIAIDCVVGAVVLASAAGYIYTTLTAKKNEGEV